MKEAFSKPIERRNDPPSHDQDLSTALNNNHHVHAMVPIPKLAHLPYVSHFLLAHTTYLQSAFHHQLIGRSLYVSKITYDLRACKTQFYQGLWTYSSEDFASGLMHSRGHDTTDLVNMESSLCINIIK